MIFENSHHQQVHLKLGKVHKVIPFADGFPYKELHAVLMKDIDKFFNGQQHRLEDFEAFEP